MPFWVGVGRAERKMASSVWEMINGRARSGGALIEESHWEGTTAAAERVSEKELG